MLLNAFSVPVERQHLAQPHSWPLLAHARASLARAERGWVQRTSRSSFSMNNALEGSQCAPVFGPAPDGAALPPALQPDLTRCVGCCHVVPVMSIIVQLDLTESVAAKAGAKGLLDPQNLTRLIEREVEAESARRDFFEMVRELRALPGEPMTMEEIQAEVDAVRAERAARENRR